MSEGTTGETPARADCAVLVEDELRRALERGLAGASERQRNLLSYLVTEELEGRGGGLKAYAIATQVLGRGADFDAQTDSIVRVEVGRLRQTLERYYLTEGAGARVTIAIPKGQYRPVFGKSESVVPVEASAGPPAPPPAAATGPRIAGLVLVALMLTVGLGLGLTNWRGLAPTPERPQARRGPLVAIAPLTVAADRDAQAYLGDGLQAELAGVLSEFNWLAVVPLSAEAARRAEENPAALGADYLLRLSVRLANGALSSTVLALDGRSGAVLWTRNYDAPFRAASVVAMERDIAARIAADLGHPLGAIVSMEETRAALDEFRSDDAFACHLRALHYWKTQAAEDYAPARACMEAARTRTPVDPNALAALALLVLAPGEAARAGTPESERTGDATRLAQRAYELNPLGLYARVARYNAALCAGDIETFRRVGAEAAGDYPNNPLILVDYGARLTLGADDARAGLPLIARAREITSKLMPAEALAPAVQALRDGRPPDLLALREASARTAAPSVALVHLAGATAAGDAEEAARAQKRLAELGITREAEAKALTGRLCWADGARNAVEAQFAKAFAPPTAKAGR